MNIFQRLGALIILSGFAIPVFADVPFNGLLLDNQLKPKKGVKIYVKNPRRYATTDKQGRFGLTDVAPDDTLTLVISRKEKLRIPVEGCRGMRIILAGDGAVKGENDDEIANTGYGYVKRREYTGVSSGISGEKLRSTGENDVLGALKGLVPGLTITGSKGNYSVNIRGIKSLTLSNEPLYLVDGIEVVSLDFLSLYDVENVEVIKEASQYGSRGANGAILVTTKTGGSRKR
ncbi:MAG: TonB-dependent receptor plug domain-containing protein [Bacteroides sp.]|nr:TonB-dependent receptor plug domain-containing protein [Bacteroides sp.]